MLELLVEGRWRTTIRLWQPNRTTILIGLLTIHLFSSVRMEVCQGEEVDVQLSEEEEELSEDRLVQEKLLVSALECPVCLCLPHSPPVYTCRVGHLILKTSAFLLFGKPAQGPTNHLIIHPRLAILCVDAAGEVSPTDAQFVSTNITGEFVAVSKYHNINCSRCSV